MGLAQVAMLRGDLATADSQFEAIAEEAQRHDLTPQLAAALHNQSVVASYAQDPWRASVLAHRALGLTTDLVERDRVLGDLGAYLIACGDYAAALDAFRILQLTASGEELRLGALGNIAVIAARIGDRQAFDAATRDLDIARFPADAQLALMVEFAAGYRRFDESTTADRWLENARLTAIRFGLSEQLADESRAQPVVVPNGKPAPDETSGAVIEIASSLRQLAASLVG
ncbi:MAG: hypothetical protein U9Q74_13345 [Gemmatimonadota bacterium]|nr:hypothetical protein [Gemmatimonadota bacterium]